MYNVSPANFSGAESPVSPTSQNEQPLVNENEVQEAPKTAQQDPMSPQFAALARKEKAIREQARQIQAEKAEMKARLEQIENESNSKWKQRISQNPWDVMIEAGLTPEQATNMILNQPKPEEIELQKLRKEIESLKNSQDDSKNLFKKQQDEQYQQAKKQINNEVKMLVDSDETYETIKHMGAQDAVTELIEQTFLQDGYLMDVEKAAQEVEEYLVDHSLKLARLKKVQSRLAPVVETTQKQEIPQKQQSNTLSNRMTPSTKPLTDRERKERAILAFQGKL